MMKYSYCQAKNTKLIGKSIHIRNLLKFIKKAAETDANVLLLGETGVGKELAARMIHSYGERKDKPFIRVNCANLSENLLESELFGFKRGAFTGAFTDKFGLIEEAKEGTFFLDEIGDIPPYIQAKLLIVIEEKELRRLGETKSRRVDVRFICASNKDLFRLVKVKKFREDLFYRISVLSYLIPPLRERREDLLVLIRAILKKENQYKSINITITPDAINKLLGYSFPGNVRELENILKRAVIFSENNVITEADIQRPDEKRRPNIKIQSKYSLNEIIYVLIKSKGNKTITARELGISRVHLYRLLKKY